MSDEQMTPKEFREKLRYSSIKTANTHPVSDSKELREALTLANPPAPKGAPAAPGVDPLWLQRTAEYWYEVGVKEGTAQWAHGLRLIKARATATLEGSPKIVLHGATPEKGSAS
jgi:hypothetical protein